MNRKRMPPGWDALAQWQKDYHARGVCITCGTRPCELHSVTKTPKLHCAGCRYRDYTHRNPVRVKYKELRKSAKRRGIPFSVTWAFFEQLARSNGYDRFVSKIDTDTLTVNRKPEGAPYSDTTIEILPLGDNVRLYHESRKRELRAKHRKAA